MSELTLKDKSVVEIGKAVGTQVATISGGGKQVGPDGGAVAQPMNPFESMMVVLEDIRDGIHQVVDRLSDSVSIQKDAIADQNAAADLAQAGGGEDVGGDIPNDEGGSDKGPGFLGKAKKKIGGLMGKGGFMGLLIKGGLIAGLVGLSFVLKKYGRKIAEFLTAGWDKLKAGVQAIIDFFSVTIPEKAKELKDAVVNFFTVTLPTKIEEIKTTLGEWFTSIKEGVANLFEKVKTFFTETIPTKFAEIKTTVTEWFTSIKEGVADLFKKIKDFFVVTIPEKYEEVKTIVTDWFTGIKDNVSDLFTKIKDFFVVTIPEKVQLIKDSITEWFTGIVEDVKGIFTKVKDFFTITIPTKVQEIKDSVTTWFTNIKDEVVGLFTKVKDFVMVTIPEKLKEMTDSIVEKVTSIKDQIVEFAMAPFRKIKELMKGLLVGVLESVEGLPFIGDKAKAMKEKIIAADRIEAGATLEEATAGLSTLQTPEQNAAQLGNVTTMPDGSVINPESGDMLKISGEAEAQTMAAELSKSGQGKFEAVFDDGGLFGRKFYKIMKTGEAVAGQSTTTGGATGGEVNSASAEQVAATSGGGGNGGAVVDASTQVNNNSSVQHQSIDDSTGLADNTVADNLNAD
jgi:hypothetical protein